MKAKKFLICLFSLCFLAIAPTIFRVAALPAAALSSKVYVSASGNDASSGSAGAPYKTFAKALANVNTGGNIYIKGEVEVPANFSWPSNSRKYTVQSDANEQGTLKFLSSTVQINDKAVTFSNINLIFQDNAALYANGKDLTVNETVSLKSVSNTMATALTVYGGGNGTTVENTNVKLYAGAYKTVFGGGNGGTVNKDVNLLVGGKFNAAHTDPHNHDLSYNVYGAGKGGTVKGDVHLTFEGEANANYIYGGFKGAGDVGGTIYTTIAGGKAMSIYGGSESGNPTCNVDLTVSGGYFEQLFGANIGANFTGDIKISLLGGRISRRVYGGCYNEVSLLGKWSSSYYVTGNIKLLIGAINLSFDCTASYMQDRAVYARSRQKTVSANEKTQVIYADQTAYNTYKSKIGKNGSSMSGVSVADKQHLYNFSANGAVITETCSLCSGHTATATLALDPMVNCTYSGKAITPAILSYSSAWENERNAQITYANNVKAGTATATVEIGGAKASLDFTIQKNTFSKPDKLVAVPETVKGKADGQVQGLSSSMEYSTDGTAWTPITNVNMQFAAGKYYFRYSETGNYNASPAAEITIAGGAPLRITFKASGLSETVKEVAYGETLTDIPTVPEKVGHSGKWETVSLENITQNLVVNAVYTQLPYTVTFKAEGHEDIVKTVLYGDALTDIPVVPEKVGYTAAWEQKDLSSVKENIVVNAVYSKISFTVVFKANGASDISKTVYYGETLTDIPTVPEKVGHSGKWETVSLENITQNLVVNAVYTQLPYTVTFKAEGHEDIVKTVLYGDALTDIPTVPEKVGYTAAWEQKDLSSVKENIVVNAIYTEIPTEPETPIEPNPSQPEDPVEPNDPIDPIDPNPEDPTPETPITPSKPENNEPPTEETPETNNPQTPNDQLAQNRPTFSLGGCKASFGSIGASAFAIIFAAVLLKKKKE